MVTNAAADFKKQLAANIAAASIGEKHYSLDPSGRKISRDAIARESWAMAEEVLKNAPEDVKRRLGLVA